MKPTDVVVSGYETGVGLAEHDRVRERRSVFAPDETIQLSVFVDGAPRPVKLAVRWLGPDGERVSEEERVVALNGSRAVPFALTPGAGHAAGAWQAEILIDDWSAMHADLEVR